MEVSKLPSNPAQVTKELVKASYSVEITRLDYEKILKSVASIEWTRENVDQPLLEPAKYVAAKITEKKEKDKRPFIDAGKIIQNEYNSVFNPLNDLISLKEEEKKKLIRVMQQEQYAAEREKNRILSIENAISEFIHGIINEITISQDDAAIVKAEKKIGSECERKGFYQEFIDKLKEQCAELKPLIVKQKEYIRKLIELQKKQEAAIKKGDESAAVQLRHEAEELREIIDESKVLLQQKAFDQVENGVSAVGEVTITAPKATRSWWKWRVDDMKSFYKKHPSLVDLVPNKEKIDTILSHKKESGELEGTREIQMDGLVFYLEQNF